MRPRVYWPVTFAATALVALLSYGVVSTGPDTSIDESISDGDRVEAPSSELRELGGDGTGSLADHQGKVVGLICHAGLVGISAGIVDGKRATGSLGIKDDLVNAGATWVDEPAFRDGNLVWGRVVPDIPDFCRELVAAIQAGQPG